MVRHALPFALLAVVFVACGGDDADEPVGDVGSFYIEARIEVVSRAETAGTNIAVTPSQDSGEETSTGTIAWWNRSPGEFRQELEVNEGDGPVRTVLVGSDGRLFIYEGRDNTYRTNEAPNLPEGLLAYPIPASIFLGPPFPYDGEDPLASARAMFAEVSDPPDDIAEKAGGEIAARDTRLFEWGPAECSRTDLAGATPVTTCSGTVRAWVDSETGFILRYGVEGETQDIDVVVTSIEYGAGPFEDSVFEFEPPPGAVETTD